MDVMLNPYRPCGDGPECCAARCPFQIRVREIGRRVTGGIDRLTGGMGNTDD